MDKNLKIALLLTADDKASSVTGRAFSRMEKQANALKKTGKAFSEIGDKSIIAGGAITAFFGKTVQDARESVKATSRLEQVFKSMGEATNKATEQAAEFASTLQFKIGVEDEEIMAVQAKLATFKRASDEGARNAGIFNRATAAAFDLQATNFGDALGNIVQLGKALQNPALGATALAKAGAINKEDLPGIKFIQATKGIPAAQKYLLNAIEKQVKGVAERTADPMTRMKIQFTESSEAIGKSLLPEVNKLADKFAEYAPKIIAFVEGHKELVINVAKAGVALLAFGASMKVIGFVISGFGTAMQVISGVGKALSFVGGVAQTVANAMMANPILLIIAAVALAAFLIYKNWGPIKEFFISLWGSITRIWGKAVEFFKGLWVKVKAIFFSFWTGVKSFLLNYTPGGLIIKHWDKISGFFSGLWMRVKEIFINHVKWVMGLGATFFNAGKNIVLSLWNGMKGLIGKPVEAIKNMVTKMRRFLPFSPAKEGPLRDIHRIKLVETIAASINAKPLINAWGKAAGGLYSEMNRPVAAVASGGGGGSQFHITINLTGGASQADGNMMADTLKAKLDKWYNDKQRQASRTNF